MERIIVSLPQDTEVRREGPSGEPFLSRSGASVFIYPLNEQNLDSGMLVVGLIEDGKESSERFYLPIISNRREQLRKTLADFEKSDGKSLSITKKLELMGEVESCLGRSEVVGPDSLRPF